MSSTGDAGLQYLTKQQKIYLFNKTQNHTSKQEFFINKVMQRAHVDFTELAKSKTSYSASLSGVGGSKGGAVILGRVERENAQHNGGGYSAGIRKTVHCESHSRHEMSKVTESWQVTNV